jgi:phosphoglycerate dehydrogenase-like enzyme
MQSIMVSPHIEAAHGQDIRQVLGSAYELVALEPGKTDLTKVAAAFLSSDYMDIGANAAVNPPLAAFLDAITKAPELKWLHICSAGADRAVLRELIDQGLVLTTSSGANAASVAHAAIAGMMAMERNVAQWVLDRHAHRWTPRNEVIAPTELGGSRATIVGVGPIGREIARVCKALDMRVAGVRRSTVSEPNFDEMATLTEFKALMPRTDWLFIACPLTAETQGLVSAEALAAMPRGARLINIARGPIVDEFALNAALRSGALAGAYSDVFATEPLPQASPLWDAPNFLMSPHSAGRSTGFAKRTYQMFMANLERWVRQEPLAHVAT